MLEAGVRTCGLDILEVDWCLQLDDVAQNCVVDVCQPGSNLLAAGYCMYSSSVVFVLSVGDGVYGFTLDPHYGEFVLTHEKIRIPKNTKKLYSFNEGRYALWDDKVKKYVATSAAWWWISTGRCYTEESMATLEMPTAPTANSGCSMSVLP
jgi:fructose-1,6-bisphosphatase